MIPPVPRPIVKWLGGKHSSIERIVRLLPDQIGTYYEPFLGGGAVFFALARANRFKRAVINDSNRELIELMWAIRDDVDGVIAAIRRLGPVRVTADKYYRIRASSPRSSAGKAARTLFLNKTGFNGLYRVNLRGEFNVPYAKVRRWRPDYDNLRAVSARLRDRRITITSDDFEAFDRQLELYSSSSSDGSMDAVYFDPPYLPESKTANFTAYTPGGFTLSDHRRLGKLFARLASRGVHVAASNAAVRGAERIYEGIPGTKIFELTCPRSINSDGRKRGGVGELLIVNPGLLGRLEP
jgi:DNA adenine methylase